jgi:hypothetical protein
VAALVRARWSPPPNVARAPCSSMAMPGGIRILRLQLQGGGALYPLPAVLVDHDQAAPPPAVAQAQASARWRQQQRSQPFCGHVAHPRSADVTHRSSPHPPAPRLGSAPQRTLRPRKRAGAACDAGRASAASGGSPSSCRPHATCRRGASTVYMHTTSKLPSPSTLSPFIQLHLCPSAASLSERRASEEGPTPLG